ncbi:MAG: PQQ-binding-like beta-propeller repeat protein, partial [Pirellulaceae bacterium]|nr:PQQ-binding-like beta-propeller repeat protein [Pirellulaceae bacterium]
PAAAPHKPRGRQKHAWDQAPKSQWDSKLLYAGSGVLLLLIAAFVVLYFAVFRGSAQETYDFATEDYRAGQYANAIKKFELFKKRFPSNPLVKSADIKIGMARLWQSFEGSRDPERALRTAQEVLPAISAIDPELFEVEARDELASILPGIADEFSKKAVSAGTTAEAEQLVSLTGEAMELVDNPMLIPGSRRKSLDARIAGIMENVARVEQGIRQNHRLVEAIGQMQQHVTAGQTNEAYAVYRELLRQYPGVEGNEELRKTVESITARVKELVQVSQEALAATGEDVQRPPTRSVVLANRLGKSLAGVDGQVAYVLAKGAAYGLEASSGRVLWRRFVGYETTYHPRPISGEPGADCLLVDQRRNEILRIGATTGDLVWRLELPEPFAEPFAAADRIYVSITDGRLLEIDPATGQSTRQARLPQPLSTSAVADDKRPQLYQVGEHSNLYVLSTDTLAASEVVYLGHKAGSVTVRPAMALGFLFVVENLGANDALVHILRTNASGLEVKTAQKSVRVTGNVLLPPLVLGRRVLLVTDRGEIRVMDIDPNADTPVSEVASNRATASESVIGYPVVSGGNLWVGDRRLSKYEIQTSRGKLAPQWVKDDGDTFVGPLHVFGTAVIATLQRTGATGTSVLARDGESGELVWQTDLGVAAAEIIVNPETRKTMAVSAGGALFEINAASVQQGYNDQPLENVGRTAGAASFTQSMDLGGRYAFTSPSDARRAVVYDPSRSSGQLTVVNLKIPSAQIRVTSRPMAFAGGLLLPLSNGQVVNLDAVTGDDHLLPFQPNLEAGKTVNWLQPALLGDGSQEFVIADDRRNLFRIDIGRQPRPHLRAAATVQLEFDLVGSLAATPGEILGVTRRGGSDTVVAFAPNDLQIKQEFPLQGRVTWGPQRVGDLVFMTNDVEGLLCFEAGPKIRWKTALPHGALAGPPVAQGDKFLLASQSGMVWRVEAQTGAASGDPIDVGEPLGDAPVIFPNGLLLPGSDGAVHLVTLNE